MDTTVKWEAHVEKAFILPPAEWILRIATIMRKYEKRIKLKGPSKVTLPVKNITSWLKEVSEQTSFITALTSHVK